MIEIIYCQQGTPEWRAAKLGVPSASGFADALAGGAGKTRDLYMRKLAGEIITGEPMESFRSAAMEHGTLVEPEARKLYEMMEGVDVQQVGFIRNGRIGCSPDGLVGTDGMVEIKREAPHLLIERLRGGGGVPAEHVPQLQGNLMVAERKWIDIVIYFPRMPLWRRRVKRDENYIARLKVGLDVFIDDLDQLVAEINRIKL